ncbi:transposase [Streptomyces sp. NPDC001820]|uniref:transposase n=1 Tax=Streptomyces sp. NPDC001820 TaxID=3364613 RepID=UPI0036B4EAD3
MRRRRAKPLATAERGDLGRRRRRDDLQSYVAKRLGDDGGVLGIDDIGFVKKGTTSAGAQRQYSGTAGHTENCRSGVFAAYASSKSRALVDWELFLPRSWTDDTHRVKQPLRAEGGPAGRSRSLR